jgi:hypothetical protein|tara:strand:- start:87 stop:419 length:333 start_codon:yes stop_codon:yes gene_type:complete
VTVSRQKRYLVTTEVGPNRDGSLSDVSTLGTDCFWSLRKARIRINRQVHMEQALHLEQALHQYGSVKVDETLNIKGKVESVDETPVGARILYVASTGALECEPLIQASKQ